MPIRRYALNSLNNVIVNVRREENDRQLSILQYFDRYVESISSRTKIDIHQNKIDMFVACPDKLYCVFAAMSQKDAISILF